MIKKKIEESYRERLKPLLSKINFALGRKPVILKTENYRKYIPEPYRAIIIFCADFELAWAWRFSKKARQSPEYFINKARQERENVPEIVKLCEKYNIPITWATVGHLFLDECSKTNGISHPEIKRLPAFKNIYWEFHQDDWFGHDPASNYRIAPEWYCPDLLKQIIESSVKHEIGCHTFSHIDCTDEVCPSDVLHSEIEACKKAAMKFNIEMKSFVHPAHTIGNIKYLAKAGFTSFRSNNDDILGYPIRHESGIWEIRQTFGISLRAGWSNQYHIIRYKKIIQRAIDSNTLCYFWFHPSFEKEILNTILPEIFKFVDKNRNQILVTTTGDYINWLINNYDKQR